MISSWSISSRSSLQTSILRQTSRCNGQKLLATRPHHGSTVHLSCMMLWIEVALQKFPTYWVSLSDLDWAFWKLYRSAHDASCGYITPSTRVSFLSLSHSKAYSMSLNPDVLFKVEMPCVLVSCKCDISPTSQHIDARSIEQLCNNNIKSFQTSVDSPETHKRCISVILRNFVSQRLGE